MEIDDDKIHDFTKDKLTWGWNGLNFRITGENDGKQASHMRGIGMDIKQDEYIIMNHNYDVTCWHIKGIEYASNPRNMFDADLVLVGA